jgi:hypothetical protein
MSFQLQDMPASKKGPILQESVDSTRPQSVDDRETDDNVLLSREQSLSIEIGLLRNLGYEQKLFRGLNAFGSFAFGFTEVGIVSSLTSLFGYGLVTGGE